MLTALKYCGAVVAGLVIAVAVISGGHWLGSLVYPAPPGLDFNNREAMAAYVAQMPLAGFLMVLASYAAASLAGSALATWLGPGRGILAGILVTAGLLGAGIMNFLSIPHPLWFALACVFSFVAFGAAGTCLAARGKALGA